MKQHKWTGLYGRDKCAVCGASRIVVNGRMQPAMLNGKRQPYCPGPQEASDDHL